MLEVIREVGFFIFVKAFLSEIYRKVWRQKINNSYSQNWEDLVIDKILGFPQNGFYVEIGAYDPKRLSNTYRFYKRGFVGITTEPNPNVMDKFKKIRPKDVFVNNGIGPKDAVIKYYSFFIPALNTFSKISAKISRKNGYKIKKIEKIKVISVKNFLTDYVNNKHIDILSLDTEGWDLKILENWDWQYESKVICVETDKDNKIKKLLGKRGYKLVRWTKYNLVFKAIK